MEAQGVLGKSPWPVDIGGEAPNPDLPVAAVGVEEPPHVPGCEARGGPNAVEAAPAAGAGEMSRLVAKDADEPGGARASCGEARCEKAAEVPPDAGAGETSRFVEKAVDEPGVYVPPDAGAGEVPPHAFGGEARHCEKDAELPAEAGAGETSRLVEKAADAPPPYAGAGEASRLVAKAADEPPPYAGAGEASRLVPKDAVATPVLVEGAAAGCHGEAADDAAPRHAGAAARPGEACGRVADQPWMSGVTTWWPSKLEIRASSLSISHIGFNISWRCCSLLAARSLLPRCPVS